MSTYSENSAVKHDEGYYSKFDPEYLPVGTTNPKSSGGYQTPQAVRSAGDLPSRLYLGDIVLDSFSITDSGWAVRYQDADPDTFVELELKEAEGPLVARFVWQGIDGMTTFTSGKDWRGLLQQLSVHFPKSWAEELRRRINAAFNACLYSSAEAMPMMVGFPDGAFQTVAIPLSSDRLPELVELLDSIDKDLEIAAAVTISVLLTEARIEYLQGHCPDVPDNPEELAQHSRNAIGLPCIGLPQYQSLDDGRRFLVVDRHIYLAHVGCSFRDLERVLSHCRRYGFIGSTELADTPSDYPHGAEWSALVLPAGMEILDQGIQYFDEESSRRIAYGRLLTKELLLEHADVRDIQREQALEKLIKARDWASLLPDVFSASNQEEYSD
jgi:hypothetical protein